MSAPSEKGVDGAGAASVSAVASCCCCSTTLVVPPTILHALLSEDANLEADAIKKVRTMMAPAENVEALFYVEPLPSAFFNAVPNAAITKLVRIIRCDIRFWATICQIKKILTSFQQCQQKKNVFNRRCFPLASAIRRRKPDEKFNWTRRGF